MPARRGEPGAVFARGEYIAADHPLPAFVMHPVTMLILVGVHVYLAFGHLAQLAAGDIEWTHFWKGFGALAGAYVFLALTSRAGRSSRSARWP